MYQAVRALTAEIHKMFVNTSGTTSRSFAVTESANAVALG
jgi:hypothetical protein